MNIEELCAKTGVALDTWNNLYPMLCVEDFPEDAVKQHLLFSPEGMNEIVLDTLTLVGSLGKTKKFVEGMESLIFRAHPGVIRMVKSLEDFRVSSSSLKATLDEIQEAQVTISGLDAAGALSYGTGATDAGFGGHLKKLLPAIQTILQGLSDLLPIVRISGKMDLSGVARDHQEMIFSIKGLLQTAQGSFDELKEKVVSAETTLTTVEKGAAAITEVKEEAEEDRDAIHKLSINAKAYLEQIDGFLAEAKDLSAKVTASDEDLTTFDAELDNRLKLFESFKEKTNQATVQNAAREKAIDDLIKQAESMLNGATVAGLASAFQKSSDQYAEQAEEARKSFKWAIGFLFLSTLPMLLYAIPLDLSALIPDGKNAIQYGSAITITLGGILSRVLFLFPATWYASFVFRRYTKLFDLHKAYQFKANIAMSVEGFRKQAENYEQEIAAAAFLDLKVPPDSGKYEHHYDGNPNGFTGVVLRAAEGIKENVASIVRGKSAAKDTSAGSP